MSVRLHPDIERLALLGWRLFPGSQRSRAACIGDAATKATHDLDTLEDWAREFPRCGWRVVMEGSGIWAMDVDVPGPGHGADGMAAMATLVEKHGPLPPGPRTRSGGGGVCLFFQHRGEPIQGKTGTPAPGLDPRRGRLSVTLPPSLHPRTREHYRWIVPPWELAPPPAPAWLLDLVKPPPRRPLPAVTTEDLHAVSAERALDKAAQKVAGAVNGSRNHTLNGQAFWMGRWIGAGLIGTGYVARELFAAARKAGLDDVEIRATLESGIENGRRDPLRPGER